VLEPEGPKAAWQMEIGSFPKKKWQTYGKPKVRNHPPTSPHLLGGIYTPVRIVYGRVSLPE